MPIVTETIKFGRMPNTGIVTIEYNDDLPFSNPPEYAKLKMQAEMRAREMNMSNRAKATIVNNIKTVMKDKMRKTNQLMHQCGQQHADD